MGGWGLEDGIFQHGSSKMKRDLSADAAATEIAERIGSWIACAGPKARYEDIVAARETDFAQMADADRDTLRNLLALMLGGSDKAPTS